MLIEGEIMGIFSAKHKDGFTLIELLVIVMILGILSAIALPQYRRSVERARVAEALTLMRAVYDSCERLAWENGKANCGVAVEDGVANFRKLDIMAKGTFADNALTLNTENFAYTLGPSITATAIKGDYQGAKIYFDGQNFRCSTSGLSGEGAKACTVWGASTWNE